MYKKKIVDALNRYEKHSLAGRRKIKPFLLENGSEKNTRAVGRKRDLSQTQNWSSVSRKPLLYLEFNKPNKQNVYEIIPLINSAFLSLKLIVDTLIDVGNCKTANIKINTNLAFRCECSSPFQGTAASKVQLTTAHGLLYRS